MGQFMTQLNPDLLIWQRPEWPYFQWDSSALMEALVQVRHQQGRLLTLAAASAAIEPYVKDNIQQDICDHPEMEMTQERLCGWQASLFPNGFSGVHRIDVGEFRHGDYTLNLKHTPPFAKTLNDQMKQFLSWWNEPPVALDGLIRAGIAYFWFMTIQPFEDGNSRVAKNLVYLALAQDEKSDLCAYNLENVFVQNQQEIESLILSCQDLNGDITTWLIWFFEKLLNSIEDEIRAKKHLSDELFFLKKNEHLKLNSRQKKIISYFFTTAKAVITNRKCVELCQTSRESIKRDLTQMVKWNLLTRNQSYGRSISYSLKN